MYSGDFNSGNIWLVNFYLFFIQMVGYSGIWIANHLNNQLVKVHYSDVSTIQIPTVHQIPTVDQMYFDPLSLTTPQFFFFNILFFSLL